MGAPKVDQAYVKAVAAARKDIQTMLGKEKSTPLFIRLAFSDALTFDKATNTGGANGSIRQALFTVTMPSCLPCSSSGNVAKDPCLKAEPGV